MKTSRIVDIVGSKSLTSPRQANVAYGFVAKELSETGLIELSFEQIEDFTSAFCNALFGKLYMNFPVEWLDDNMTLQLDNHIWSKKISDSRMLGVNENLRKMRMSNLEELIA